MRAQNERARVRNESVQSERNPEFRESASAHERVPNANQAKREECETRKERERARGKKRERVNEMNQSLSPRESVLKSELFNVGY